MNEENTQNEALNQEQVLNDNNTSNENNSSNEVNKKVNPNILKRQKEFEKMVLKAKQEEEKRIKEQEKKLLELEKKEAEKLKKQEEERKKDEAIALAKKKKDELSKKSGKPANFSSRINTKKVKVSKKELLELEAKKEVLNEQFKNQSSEIARFKTPILFEYIARNKNGDIEKSTIEALSRVDVHSFLLAEGYEVYDITAAKVSSINIGSFKFKRSKLIFYLSQLSAYLKAGIALADAVKILDNQSKNVNEKKVWRAVYYDLSMGDNLSNAMEKRKNAFPKLLVNMIKTAEMTGNLTETLDDMVNYYTETETTSKQMKSAMIYPAVVIVFAVSVVTFILLWVIPQFVDIYKDLDADLPIITQITITISNFLKNNFLFIAIVLLIFIIAFIFSFKRVKAFRKKVQQIMMHIPVLGNIIIYNEVTIFTKTFANLINHNVFITDSMDVLIKITENEIYKELIFNTANNLTKGETISKAFENHWAFPVIAYQMLITGEKTGRLGQMMEKVSEYYQEQHRDIISRMKSLIEPILIIFLAVVVGFILLSVILPMFSMYNALQA